MVTNDITAILPITYSPASAPNFTAYFANPGTILPKAFVAPYTFDPSDIRSLPYPAVTAIAADGMSAAVIVIGSNSSAPVKLTLSTPANPLVAGALGSLAPYAPDYLTNPAPTSGNTTLIIQEPSSPSSCGGQGNPDCIFLALLWAPLTMPLSATNLQSLPLPPVPIEVTATQTDQSVTSTAAGGLALQPPPLVLVHGLWSDSFAWSDFENWLTTNSYLPQDEIILAHYSDENYIAFSDPLVQNRVATAMYEALTNAQASGVVATQVDVVAHSMGGLATRYLISQGVPSWWKLAPPKVVHRLITVGTPHEGSPLPATLEAKLIAPPLANAAGIADSAYCKFANGLLGPPISPCTLSGILAFQNKPVGTAIQSMVPGSASLNMLTDTDDYMSVVGVAPPASTNQLEYYAGSGTELELDLLTVGFAGQTIPALLGTPNDTIVPAASQEGPAPSDTAKVNGIVHDALVDNDTDEKRSPAVWCRALYWLIGQSGQNSATCATQTGAGATQGLGLSIKSRAKDSPESTASPLPSLDLTGYTQVDASNVTFSPASGSTLPINAGSSITATSSTKTITEIVLLQAAGTGGLSTDVPMLYATETPFSIAFTPTRTGSTNFVAFALFSDMTYAVTALGYAFQPSGLPIVLTLLNPPAGNLAVGSAMVVRAQAGYSTGQVNVTPLATYAVRSRTSSVFTIASGGIITTTGSGFDWLDVSYGGFTASTQITAGSCAYSLSPLNQIVDYIGGTVTIEVTTADGCAWTADEGGTAWLKADHLSGTGSGTITLTASANTTGSTQVAFVTVANQDVAITQPATACTYDVSQTPINVPAGGVNGNLAVTSSCPVVASSDATWLTVVSLGSSISYFAAENPETSQRTATMTVGTKSVTVKQAPGTPPQANLTPNALSFGSQNVGVSSSPSGLMISNSGTANLTISGISITGSDNGDFAVVAPGTTCSTSAPLPGGTNCTISVTFTPSATGNRSASLKFTDNATNSPQTVSLTGTGLPAIAVTLSPASASVALGGTQLFTATISNATNTALNWYVNGVLNGSSTQGKLTGTGLTRTYTAPSVNVPSPNPAVITVASAADPTKTKTATVTVTDSIAVTLSPSVRVWRTVARNCLPRPSATPPTPPWTGM